MPLGGVKHSNAELRYEILTPSPPLRQLIVCFHERRGPSLRPAQTLLSAASELNLPAPCCHACPPIPNRVEADVVIHSATVSRS